MNKIPKPHDGKPHPYSWQADTPRFSERNPTALRSQLQGWKDRCANLEDDIERLKVCGTCGHMEQWDDDVPGCHYEICNIDFGGGVGDAAVASPCRLTPSRWMPYWERT